MWRFFRHEDIARDPLGRFEEMFGYLGLPFGEAERAGVAAATDPSNPSESTSAGVLKRDSRSTVKIWKTRLSEQQIDRIRRGTDNIAAGFYSDVDW